MPPKPLLDVREHTVVFRLVEYLMKKSFVDDKLLVGGGDFFIEHLRPGRIDETIGASLEDQNRKSDPVRSAPTPSIAPIISAPSRAVIFPIKGLNLLNSSNNCIQQ